MINHKHAASLTYGVMSTEGTILLHAYINKIKEVDSNTKFLDVGSGEGLQACAAACGPEVARGCQGRDRRSVCSASTAGAPGGS